MTLLYIYLLPTDIAIVTVVIEIKFVTLANIAQGLKTEVKRSSLYEYYENIQ